MQYVTYTIINNFPKIFILILKILHLLSILLSNLKPTLDKQNFCQGRWIDLSILTDGWFVSWSGLRVRAIIYSIRCYCDFCRHSKLVNLLVCFWMHWKSHNLFNCNVDDEMLGHQLQNLPSLHKHVLVYDQQTHHTFRRPNIKSTRSSLLITVCFPVPQWRLASRHAPRRSSPSLANSRRLNQINRLVEELLLQHLNLEGNPKTIRTDNDMNYYYNLFILNAN